MPDPQPTCRSQPGKYPGNRQPIRFSAFRFWYILLFLVGCRVGEASLPGPVSGPCWTIGVCNPSGLQGKSHYFSALPTDLLTVSETHLTTAGRRSFQRGLTAAQTGYRTCVTGAPLAPRSSVSNIGEWAGVAFLSPHPCRSLPVPWPEQLFESGRVQFASSFWDSFWVTGGVVYGFPAGVIHKNAKVRTEAILDFMITHVTTSVVGPRFLAGDWNYEPDQLEACRRLISLGWREIQDLELSRSGCLPRNTCKHKTRKDHLWISPELQHWFLGLEFYDLFADHVSFVASFLKTPQQICRWVWPRPQEVNWENVPDLPHPFDFTQGSPTDVYSQMWQQREQLASSCDKHWNIRKAGRAQIKSPVLHRGWPTPPRKARTHDIQPAFHGFSVQHLRWMKQLRRVQSYCRWALAATLRDLDNLHGISLWSSILAAPGFGEGFQSWWPQRSSHLPFDPECVPLYPPSAFIADRLYQALLFEVRILEDRLNSARVAHAKQLRNDNPDLIFRDLKSSAPAPVESLLLKQQTFITAVCRDDCALEIDPPCVFDEGSPILSGGHTLEVIHAEPDKLWVENLHDIQEKAPVIQSQLVGTLPELFDAFHEQWKQRWCRHDLLPNSQWKQIIDFAVYAFPQQHLPHLVVDQTLLKAEVHRKKARTATGLDGVSRLDLLRAPSNVFQSLVSCYHRAEKDGLWPQQLLAGAVVSLAKTPQASKVNEYRPITIFGLPYRLWSGLHARYVLDHADTWVDAGVFGNRRGHQAAHMWSTILHQVSDSYASSSPLSGLIADIEKAYNCLPRWPVFNAAVLAGTPDQVTTAWAGATAQMVRHFKIRDSYSQGFLTSTGLAEGDALSCYGMLLVDHLFHRWVAAQAPTINSMSYVDNWELTTKDSHAAIAQLDVILGFASLLDLTIDRTKTFGWSTCPKIRSELRSAGIPIKHCVRDLGAHLAFSKQRTNKTVVDRIHSLEEFWDNLRKSLCPYHLKVRALRTIAWPRGLHAVSSTPLGKSLLTGLRSKACQALMGRRAGVNPLVLLGLLESDTDPQWHALVQTVRDVRAFAPLDFLPDSVAPFAAGHCCLPPNSPASVLVTRLHQIGFSISLDGLVRDCFGSFSLMTCNFNELSLRLSFGWALFIGSSLSHRADFNGVSWVDVNTTRRRLGSFSPPQRALLRLSLAGAMFTGDNTFHWSETGSVNCKWCGQTDSLSHRYWKCQQTKELRDKLAPRASRIFARLPRVLALRGWAVKPPSWLPWMRYLASLSKQLPKPGVDLTMFCSKTGWVDLFTDGSCLAQSEPTARCAAWSVVVATPFHEDWNFETGGTLASQVLPGMIQTAFRAELYALGYALHQAALQGVAVRIWTDCLGVVNRYHFLARCGRDVRVNTVNADLWCWIRTSVQSLGAERIQVIKVAAHQSLARAKSRRDCWKIWNNDAADLSAKSANLNRTPDAWELWGQLVRELEECNLLHDEICKLHLAVAELSTMTNDLATLDEVDVPCPRRQNRIFETHYDDTNCNFEVTSQLRRQYPGRLPEKVATWWKLRTQGASSLEVKWIPIHILYLDFMMAFGCPGPIRVQQKWMEWEMCPFLTPEKHRHSVRARWFRKYLVYALKSMGVVASTATCRGASEILQAFLPCISTRWDETCLEQVEIWLSRNLSSHCAREARELRSVPMPEINSRMVISRVQPKTGS